MNVEFIEELNTLLTKYNASIHWGCDSGSDLHGVTGEYMAVTDQKDKTLLMVDGACISAYEIKLLGAQQ